MRRLIIATTLVLAIATGLVATSAPVGAAPDTPAELTKVFGHDRDNTAPSYDICAWTGVRDGVLGLPGTKLVHYHNFTWSNGEVAVHCKSEIRVPPDAAFATCHGWMVDRGTGYTYHLGPCQFGAD